MEAQSWVAHNIKTQSTDYIFVTDFELRKITTEEKLKLL